MWWVDQSGDSAECGGKGGVGDRGGVEPFDVAAEQALLGVRCAGYAREARSAPVTICHAGSTDGAS